MAKAVGLRSSRPVSSAYLKAVAHANITTSANDADDASRSSAIFSYGEACTWKSRNAAERMVPRMSCIIVSWASTISPTRTKRRIISISSHQKRCGSAGGCGDRQI